MLELVTQSEANTAGSISETIGDCAYGDGPTRQAFVDQRRILIAPVPAARTGEAFPKERFVIDPAAHTCCCPASHVTTQFVPGGSHTYRGGKRVTQEAFQFPAALCRLCPLYSQCIVSKRGGPRVLRHAQEALLQEGRCFQQSAAYRAYRTLRQAAEHRLARLVQMGDRQARYVGRCKTVFQLFLAATITNLTLVATATGLMRGATDRQGALASIHLFKCISTANDPVFG